MAEVAFVGETFPHRSLNVSAQRTLNMYPEVIGVNGTKSQYILVGTPGSTEWIDLSSETADTCRGMHFTATSKLYVVYGDKLLNITSTGTIAKSYTLSGLSTRVHMADNGKYLLIADGENIWRLNMISDVFDTVTLPTDLVEPKMVKYIKQRFVTFGSNSNEFYYSEVGPDGPLTWYNLSMQSAEGSADFIVSMGVTDGELVLFGDRSYQVYGITSDPDQPFAEIGGSYTNIGCGAPESVAEISGRLYWLGSSNAGVGQIYVLDGYNAKTISNPAITHMLNGKITSDGYGFTYQQESHEFYVLSFTQSNFTIVYDSTTGQWHERSTRDPLYNKENKWEPSHAVYAFDKVLVGNSKVNKIIELQLSKYNEYDGRAIKRQRISPIYWDDTAPVRHLDFVLDMETGVGLTDDSVQGHNPQVMLRYSHDSGHTWSSERWRPIGKVGQYTTRCRWTKLGIARNRVYEITITDPVKVVLVGASVTSQRTTKR